jgi:hypothetical protein
MRRLPHEQRPIDMAGLQTQSVRSRSRLFLSMASCMCVVVQTRPSVARSLVIVRIGYAGMHLEPGAEVRVRETKIDGNWTDL